MKWLNCEKIKVLLIVFVAAVVLGGGSAKADFSWMQKADMPIKRIDHSTCVVDGKIYVIGGWHAIGELNPQWEALTRVDVYDPATDTWTRKADMPTARGYTNACVVDGKIYVIGGDAGSGYILAVEVYDPVADTWTRKADIPTRRRKFSASETDGIIYVIGGKVGGHTHLNTVEAYDTVTDTWTTKAHMPTARNRLSTCVVDGLIYAIGGGWGSYTNRVEVYDPATDTWTRKTYMPTGRIDLDVVVVCGKVYAIGGWQHSVQGPIYSTVEVYDPFTDTWSSGVDIPVTTAGLSASVVDGRIYVMGGATETTRDELWVLTSAVYEYKPLNLPPDFNNDFKIDIEDLIILIENWGQEEPCFDIAPLPFGDGIVDKADLEVFMSYWGQEIDDPSLIAHWKLDETEGSIAYDSAGEYDGTLHGEPLWQPEGGVVDGALELDGIDDYIGTPFVLSPVVDFSIFAWIKGGGPGQTIISQANKANWLLADPSEGRLMTDLKEAGRFGKSLISDAVITDGAWHRIGITWDGSSRTLYVDDVEVATDVQGDLEGSEGGLYIGAGKNLETGSFWSGLIDDVRIYNRAIKP